MSHFTNVYRSHLLATATAISAGFLTVASPAQAHPIVPLPQAPACSQYSFPNGDWPIQIEGGDPLIITTHHGANAAGPVRSSKGNHVGSVTSGGIYTQNVNNFVLSKAAFNITFADSGVIESYSGDVAGDGLVHNGYGTPSANIPAATWVSTRPLECNDAAAPPQPPAAPPAPPAAAPAVRLGVSVAGPTTLATGMSGTYTANVSNPGDLSAPVELYISYGGNLQQTGQVTPSGGFNCDVINNAGGTTAVHCTAGQLPSKATATITVQGRGSAPGAAHLTVNINSSDPAAQFVQKSQTLNVAIT